PAGLVLPDKQHYQRWPANLHQQVLVSTGRGKAPRSCAPKRTAGNLIMQEGLHKIVSSEETIVAISTPLGHSGLGVLRMSGSQVLAIGRRFFQAHSGSGEFNHREAIVGRWLDGRGEEIDEVVVTFFRAPHSYTGEDILEISAHGNPIILSQIVES